MRFTSLSDAIRYHTHSQNSIDNVAPYGSLAVESQQIPLNTNYFNPESPNVMTYGKTLWGTGIIIDIENPIL